MGYLAIESNEWVRPVRTGYRMMCCDCGLVHEVDFRVVHRHIELRARRNMRATAQLRRHRREDLVAHVSSEEVLDAFRKQIEELYRSHPTGCGGSFGEILCFEIHDGDQDELLDFDESRAKNGPHGGCDFTHLAKKWGISVTFLGELVAHHCALLEDLK